MLSVRLLFLGVSTIHNSDRIIEGGEGGCDIKIQKIIEAKGSRMPKLKFQLRVEGT